MSPNPMNTSSSLAQVSIRLKSRRRPLSSHSRRLVCFRATFGDLHSFVANVPNLTANDTVLQYIRISITPFDFSMQIAAMTSEKLKFSLPAVFTIGPEDNEKSLEKYAVLLAGDSDGQVNIQKGNTVATGRNHVQDIVKGIIEGETR